jgi:hypothetical protein
MDHDALRARYEQLADGYFDTRGGVIVQRAVSALPPDALEDPALTDEALELLLDVLESRYARSDAGWVASLEELVRGEWRRHVEQELALLRRLEDEA